MITITPLPTPHRFGQGDNIVRVLLAAVNAAGFELQDGDVVCVASKIVALAEGQTVSVGTDETASADSTEAEHHAARRRLAREGAAAIVADAPQVLVTRTHHGFVVANNGIDASNVADGQLLLLPDDPDASARALRSEIAAQRGVDVGVVITDTFGRPWRNGQTDVAIGLAGVSPFRDERTSGDLDGRELVVTEPALADEIAAAADLVRTKASGTPFVLLRGLATGGLHPVADGARALVRPPALDLFAVGGPTAAEHAIAARRTVRTFDATRPVPIAALQAAARAAATAPAPHHTRPWRLIHLTDATRERLLDAMAEQWRRDLAADGTPDAVIERRIARSDRVLRDAPAVLAAFVETAGAHTYPDQRRQQGERDLFMLSGGAALQNVQIVLAAHGLGAAWISSTAFCPPTVRAQLGLAETWQPMGMLAIGYPDQAPPARGDVPYDDVLLER